MADFNGLWKVKIREKLLLEATSDISKIVFSSLPHFSSPPPPLPFLSSPYFRFLFASRFFSFLGIEASFDFVFFIFSFSFCVIQEDSKKIFKNFSSRLSPRVCFSIYGGYDPLEI